MTEQWPPGDDEVFMNPWHWQELEDPEDIGHEDPPDDDEAET